MSTSLNDFVSRIQPIIRDRTNNTVEVNDIRDSLNRGIRNLQNRYGIYATKNRAAFEVFTDIYEYPLPTDFHDVIEMADPGTPTHFTKKTPFEFWKRLNQQGDIMAVDTILGDRFLLLNSTGGPKTPVHTMDSLTTNGTWAVVASTDAVDIAEDTNTKKVGAGSVRFDVDVSASANDFAAIENGDMSSVDLSDHENVGTLFVQSFIPDATNITGFTARWGSSSSDYYESSVTTAFNGRTLRDGWNRLGFSWADASTTGSPDSTAVDYMYLQITYSASQTDDTGFRFDDVFMGSPVTKELMYYSKYFVKGSDGTLKESFADGDDASLLEDQDDDVLFFYALSDAQLIKQTFEEQGQSLRNYENMLSYLRGRYMSEKKRESYSYYTVGGGRSGR